MLIPRINMGIWFVLKSLAYAREEKETDRCEILPSSHNRGSGRVVFPLPNFSTHEVPRVPLGNQLLAEGHLAACQILTNTPEMLQVIPTARFLGSPPQGSFQIVLYPMYLDFGFQVRDQRPANPKSADDCDSYDLTSIACHKQWGIE